MLSKLQFSWVGKLPINADFIQSKNDIELEQTFIKWMIEGQDHIGEQMFKQGSSHRFIYYFSMLMDTKHLHGLMILSEDQRHRQCPFILFAQKGKSSLEILDHLKVCFETLGFDIGSLIWKMNNQQLFEELYTNLSTLPENASLAKAQQWVEAYPKLMDFNLSAEALSPILYRKLVHRQV